MDLVAKDFVLERTKLFLKYIRKFLNHLDPAKADDYPISDYEVKILHLAYFVAVYPDALVKSQTLRSRRFLGEACHAAAEFDRVALSVVSKIPLSLDDLHGLFAALRSNLDAYTYWRAEDNLDTLATDTQRVLGSFTPTVDSLSHEEIIEGSLRVSAMCIKISYLVNEVYESATTPSMGMLMAFITETREKYPQKTFPPIGYTRSSFSIDAIIERATPPIEDGVFHIDLEGDCAIDSLSPLTLAAIKGELVFCYAVTVIRGAQDSVAIMMLNEIARELRKNPSIVPWAREFYEQVRNDHFDEIRRDRANTDDEHMHHSSIIGADIAPPCSTPRSLSA